MRNYPSFTFSLNNLLDFIFIFYFVGNDFLPCQRFINIYGNGANILFDNYIKCIVRYNNIVKITENEEIEFNIIALYYFIQLCTVSEYEEFTKLKETRNKDIYFKIEKLKKTYNSLPSEYEKELFKFENNGLTIYNYQNLNVLFEDYKFEFYRHFTNSIDNQKKIINSVCDEYLKTLKWNIEYYTFGCKDWRICYSYPISPFFDDLQNFIADNNLNINNYKLQVNKPLTSSIQLLLCIPRTYLRKYIPEIYKLITFKNGFMFPEKYKMDLSNQICLYKSIVLIPRIQLQFIFL